MANNTLFSGQIFLSLIFFALLVALFLYARQEKIEFSTSQKRYMGLFLASGIILLIIPVLQSFIGEGAVRSSELRQVNAELARIEQDISRVDQEFRMEEERIQSQQKYEADQAVSLAEEYEELEREIKDLKSQLSNQESPDFYDLSTAEGVNEVQRIVGATGSANVQSDNHLQTSGLSDDILPSQVQDEAWDIFVFGSNLLTIKQQDNNIEFNTIDYQGKKEIPILLSQLEELRKKAPDYGS